MEVANVLTVKSLMSNPGYKVERGVPVFRPHRRFVLDEKGKPTDVVKYEVKEEDLPEICEVTNYLAEKDCHLPRATIGHVAFSGTPETEQPAKWIGHWINYRVGVMPDDGSKVILADRYTVDKYEAQAKEFPFRSAEYNFKQKRIGGVALLLKDPALGLGSTSYYESNDSYTCYADAMMEPNNPEQTPSGTNAGVLQPDEAVIADRMWAYFKAQHPECFGGEKPKEKPGELPKDEVIPKPKEDDEEKGESKMNDQEKAAYAALQGEVETLRATNKALKMDADKAKVKVILDDLSGPQNRYELDDRADLEVELLSLSEADRAKRVERIKKTYKQKQVDPNAEQIQVLEGNSAVEQTSQKGLSQAAYLKAHAYMTKNDSTWAEAIAATK